MSELCFWTVMALLVKSLLHWKLDRFALKELESLLLMNFRICIEVSLLFRSLWKPAGVVPIVLFLTSNFDEIFSIIYFACIIEEVIPQRLMFVFSLSWPQLGLCTRTKESTTAHNKDLKRSRKCTDIKLLLCVYLGSLYKKIIFPIAISVLF